MYKKFVTALFSINYFFQAIFCLASPIGLMSLLSWFLTSKFGIGTWIYAVLIVIGVFAGIYSMVRYVLAISEVEKRREEQSKKDEERRHN